MRIGIIIAICLVYVLGQQGSQKRRLFYSTTDYVCHSGVPGRKDITYLTALVYDEKGDRRRIKVVADCGTLCDSLILDPRRTIMAVKDWDYLYYNDDRTNVTWFRFNQTIQKEYEVFSKLLKSIVVTSTVFNPCTIEDKLYDCNLIDSEGIDHYGIYEAYPASIHELICKPYKK